MISPVSRATTGPIYARRRGAPKREMKIDRGWGSSDAKHGPQLSHPDHQNGNEQ